LLVALFNILFQFKNLGTIPIRQQRGNCGKVTASYFKVREANVADLLSRISKKLREYVKRVEGIESFVYMHCVGIQLEKHFEKRRKKLVEGELLHDSFKLIISMLLILGSSSLGNEN